MTPIAILLGVFAVVSIDQTLKFCAMRFLPRDGILLGPLGKIRVSERRIWLSPLIQRFGAHAVWMGWLAGSLIIGFASLFWGVNPFFGVLLVGGSASHALETSRRGAVCDYVWLRFWPGFNFADVAIAVGAIGLATTVVSLQGSA
jgi:hypothetical protein